MRKHFPLAIGVISLFLIGIPVWAAVGPQPQSGPFATPVTDASLDPAHFAEWSGGQERPLKDPNALRQVVWTRTAAPAGSGAMVSFGVSSQPGPRSLRLSFAQPMTVGSVLVRGGDQLSVLRPGAQFPGNLTDESQWMPAQRITAQSGGHDGPDRDGAGGMGASSGPDNSEVAADGYALWVLPSPTQTRAIRFTHVAKSSDTSYAGVLGGVYVLSTRYANLATQATVSASANGSSAGELIDEKYNGWTTWDNGPNFLHAVSAAHPEWVLLSWTHPVTLRGLAALWAGFNAADVEVFTGPADASLDGAPESEWRKMGNYTLSNQYPVQLGVDWMDFGADVTTRAVRLRVTAVTNESRHPHLAGKTHNGNRVWLGELMALSSLGSGGLQAAMVQAAPPTVHPPIPVHFTLQTAGFVSLVIDDASGNRVRNLVSDTYFPAGANTVWWDGSDDLGRDADAETHGEYYIPTRFVAPGTYTVRGIEHQAIDLHYEFSVYYPGNPPWDTTDGTGGWLTTHTPAWATLFVPADKAPGGKPLVYLGCEVAEGGSGLAWVDLNGNKQGGRTWVGGTWTAAPFLARDSGARANPDIYVYAASVFGDTATVLNTHAAVLRLTGLSAHGDKPLLNFNFNMGAPVPGLPTGRDEWPLEVAGLAVRDNVVAVSFPLLNQILLVDGTSGKILGQPEADNPRGLAFDGQGNLLVLSGKRLVRFRTPAGGTLNQPQVVIGDGLDDPQGITLDGAGNIYISDRGNSDQVKVFSTAGRLIRVIGHAGPSKTGPYDPLHMNNPRGITIDTNQHLWVAEESFQPKRVSVWTLDGQLVKSFIGGPEYGGGGSLDPADKTLFYYDGMEFKLDWNAGTSTLTDVVYLRGQEQTGPVPMPKLGAPTSVLENHGHRYFINSYLSHPTIGPTVAMLYLEQNGVAQPVAAMGKANDWSALQGDAFRSSWPAGVNPASNQPQDSVFFSWSDSNGNGLVEPAEVTMQKSKSGWLTIMPDLSIVDAYLDGNAVRFAPSKVSPQGIPAYDLRSGQTIATGAQLPLSDGGGEALYGPEGTVLTTAPQPFPRESIGGVDMSGHRWSYPNLWPGLHPSHNAPVADRPGELIGTTHLLGGFLHPGPGTEALWGINGNEGSLYLFTAEGFFVTQLFQDIRLGHPWEMPTAQRNMLLNQASLHDENFFPSMAQTTDGKIYVSDGQRTAIVRVDGLNTVQKLPPATLQVTSQNLTQAQGFFQQRESARQQQQGAKALTIGIASGPAPALGNVPDLLQNAQWATIDHRINTIYFGHSANDAQAALMVAGGRLIAAFRTGDANLLRNSGAVANAAFKTGGALDLMIGSEPNADPKRKTAVAGDERLLVYQVSGQTKALLYRQVAPGAKNPAPFSSPLRTITMDSVTDVSSEVQLQALGGDQAGMYVISIPLQTLGLKPTPGQSIKADVGLLRGDGTQTLQRVYWSNKATGIVSDVPSEAELTPALWGQWTFQAAQ